MGSETLDGIDQYTQEPWYVGSQNDALYITAGKRPANSNDYPDHDAVRELIAKIFGSYPLSDANARRIVACVNACAGASTESLEQHGFLAMRTKQVIELEKQRDELVAALKRIHDEAMRDLYSNTTIVRLAQQALVKVCVKNGEES